MENSWGLIIRTQNSSVATKAGVKVQGQFAWVPSQLCFFIIMPVCIQWHDVLEAAELRGGGPSWDRDAWKRLVDEVTPKPVSSHWPLPLQVKGELVERHVCCTGKGIDVGHGIREMEDCGHTFQQDVISLQEPSTLQDAVEAVASVVVHAVHVTLPGESLTWESTCYLQVVGALE